MVGEGDRLAAGKSLGAGTLRADFCEEEQHVAVSRGREWLAGGIQRVTRLKVEMKAPNCVYRV